MLPSRNAREMSNLSVFISGTGTSGLSADSLDLFLGLVKGCNGHDHRGPQPERNLNSNLVDFEGKNRKQRSCGLSPLRFIQDNSER